MNYVYTVIQGDQIDIPISIIANGVELNNIKCAALRVSVGGYEDSWPSGTIKYKNRKWYFHVTEDMSRSFPTGEIPMQVQFTRNGTNYHSSEVRMVKVLKTAFKDKWQIGG